MKLHITVADGKAAVEQEDAPLMSDGFELKDGALAEVAPEIVPAGGPSVEDGVITGTMNYFVEGVKEA